MTAFRKPLLPLILLALMLSGCGTFQKKRIQTTNAQPKPQQVALVCSQWTTLPRLKYQGRIFAAETETVQNVLDTDRTITRVRAHNERIQIQNASREAYCHG